MTKVNPGDRIAYFDESIPVASPQPGIVPNTTAHVVRQHEDGTVDLQYRERKSVRAIGGAMKLVENVPEATGTATSGTWKPIE